MAEPHASAGASAASPPGCSHRRSSDLDRTESKRAAGLAGERGCEEWTAMVAEKLSEDVACRGQRAGAAGCPGTGLCPGRRARWPSRWLPSPHRGRPGEEPGRSLHGNAQRGHHAVRQIAGGVARMNSQGKVPMFIPAKMGGQVVLLPFEDHRRTLVGFLGCTCLHLHFNCAFCEALFSVNCQAGSRDAVSVVNCEGCPPCRVRALCEQRAMPAWALRARFWG